MFDRHETEVRERVKALADRVDRELDADRRFFERRPDRSYRVRRAFRAEAETTQLVLGGEWPITFGRMFTAVRQIAPGVRARAFFIACRDLETDLSDADAARVFDAVNGSTIPDDVAKIVAEKREGGRS